MIELGEDASAQAIQVLQSNNWSLDQSLQSFFSGGIPDPAVASVPQTSNNRGQNGNQRRRSSRYMQTPPSLPWPLSLLETIVNTILQIGEPETVESAFRQIGIGSFPNFSTGAFNRTLRHGRDQKKMVCVYFHSPSHDDTPLFLETLATPEICNYMDSNFINHAINVQTPQG